MNQLTSRSEVLVPSCPAIMDDSILDTIGNTPLIEIKHIGKEFPNVKIFAKAEWRNAGGSVKSRPALSMIEDGEKTGKLTKDKVLLDSTSGNTGIAYALIGKVKGYKVKLVMPENVINERKGKMAAFYGAEIIASSPFEGSDGAIVLAKKIYQEDPEKYFMPDQYSNDANWKAHYDHTSKEIWEQTEGKVTHFTAGIGTSGTLMGNTRGLKRFNQNIKCYAVEPAEELHGLEGLKHMASSIVPKIYDQSVFDGVLSVSTEDGYDMVGRLEREEGILVGNSAGAAMQGALDLASQIKEGVIVTVFPDSCEKCYNDFWHAIEPSKNGSKNGKPEK